MSNSGDFMESSAKGLLSKTGALPTSETHTGDIAKLLKKIISAKGNSSKVVDINGEPLVVYHGIGADFTEFYASGMASRGTNFFTSDKNLAKKYAKDGRIYEVFLSMKDPEIIDAEGKTYQKWVDDTGGWKHPYISEQEIIVKNLKDSPSGNDHRIKTSTIYAVGNKLNNQIKSADNNNGNFDEKKSDIRFQATKNLQNSSENDNFAKQNKNNEIPDKGSQEKLGSGNEVHSREQEASVYISRCVRAAEEKQQRQL